ncbi:hypothetical protein [Atlantibacter hermannii]|uniref:hypothetical protein n=1 Tax=Atlantibacter hermannii TaxID=565 RepID=UPI002FE3F8AB
MTVLEQLIQDALNHQRGHIRTDGNGEVTQVIPVTPAAVRYLSLNEVLTPKGGNQTTFNAILAERSLVAQAGATIIRQPGPMTQTANETVTMKQVTDRFVVIEPGKFAKVPDGAELEVSGKPYLVAAYDSANVPSYGVGFTLTRQQLKHEFPDDTVLRAVNTAIERGIADLADFILLDHLATAGQVLTDATFKGLAKAAAARGLRWDEIRAIVGGDCTGLEVDGAGILRAFGARAEITNQTDSTIVGAFNRAAIGIDDELRVTAKRVLNGGVEVLVWANAMPLVPDATAFWVA